MAENDRLKELDDIIACQPGNYDLYMDRGKEYYRRNNFGAAQNDFRKALELNPGSKEAEQFISVISEILEYRNTDFLNP